MRLQTIDLYEYCWGPVRVKKGSRSVEKELAPDSLIRLVIGESIPPRFLELLGNYIIGFTKEPLPTRNGAHAKTTSHQPEA